MRYTQPIGHALFVGLCLEALFATAYRGTFLLTHSLHLSWLAAAAVLGFAALCFRYRARLLGRAGALFPERWAGSRLWFVFWLGSGIVLRLAWVHAYPVLLKSDGAAYYAAATEFAAHRYTGVYWPPGLPLVLSPFMMFLGSTPSVTVVVSLLLFAGTCGVAWLLAREVGGKRAAGAAVALLAVWPGYLTTVGINSKENLIALLLPGAMLLYLRATRQPATNRVLLACAGALLGYAALTQPGCLLFLAVIAGIELVRRASLIAAAGRIAVVGLAMLAVILPWTLRNYRTTHRPILITVNGGSVFYRANNPLANASYAPEGAIHLPADIYEADRVGYREGKRWIAQHPAAFFVLAVRKQVGYLGDDGIGVYETLERDAHPPRALYAAAKALCSGYWLLLWLVMLMGASRLFRMRPISEWYGLCFLPVLYQWLIDSVFESGSRHHLSDVAFLAILVALAMAQAEKKQVQGERHAV